MVLNSVEQLLNAKGFKQRTGTINFFAFLCNLKIRFARPTTYMKSKIKPGTPAVKQAAKPVVQKSAQKPINVKVFYLIIIALAFILYGNTISNNYSLDDSYVTGSNPIVQQGIKAIPTIFSSNYITMNAEEGGQHSYGYRPIAKATYAIEWSIFGENPHVSHFINLLLYAFTGLLIFKIFRKLLKGYSIWLPFLTVFFFMIHPLHTEVVASLKNREELLSFLGGLMCIFYFLRWHETGRSIFILWAHLAFIFGYLSKVNIMTLLFGIPLIFYYFTELPPKKIIIAVTVSYHPQTNNWRGSPSNAVYREPANL